MHMDTINTVTVTIRLSKMPSCSRLGCTYCPRSMFVTTINGLPIKSINHPEKKSKYDDNTYRSCLHKTPMYRILEPTWFAARVYAQRNEQQQRSNQHILHSQITDLCAQLKLGFHLVVVSILSSRFLPVDITIALTILKKITSVQTTRAPTR